MADFYAFEAYLNLLNRKYQVAPEKAIDLAATLSLWIRQARRLRKMGVG